MTDNTNEYEDENTTEKQFDPRTDQRYREYFERELLAIAAKEDAERFTAQSLWTPPPFPTSLAEQLEEKEPEIPWVFKELQPEGKGMLNAQKKAGKTTALMNMCASLVTGESLFSRFEVNVSDDEQVGYLNLELSKEQFNHEMKKLKVLNGTSSRVEIYHAMNSGRLDFKNHLQVEWLIEWLKNSGIRHLFIDPLSSIYLASEWGRDPNDAFNRWWMILEDIHREANLRLTMIAHHTGVNEEAANRGRGASAMGDKPDVNMGYRYNVEEGASHTDKPNDNKRYLAAFGRGGVNVNDFEVVFNPLTNLLEATYSGQSRKDSEAHANAIEMWRKINDEYKRTGKELNKGQVFNILGWAQTGKAANKYGNYYHYGIRMGWVQVRDGSRNGTGSPLLHKPGITPLGETA